jgi:hypothetical protein
MPPKELRDLIKEAKSQGWTVELTKGHYWFTAPDGYRERTASTPSDHRWLMNAVSRMRKHGFVWKGR